MKNQLKNKIHTWVVRVLLVLVMAVALGTFYVFMIQTSFGLSVSNAKEEHSGLMVINCFPNGNVETSEQIIFDVIDDDIKLKNYTYMIPYEHIVLYEKGTYVDSENEFKFVSDNSISCLNPKILEGSLNFVKRKSRERLKVKNPDYEVPLDKLPKTAKSDSTKSNRKYVSRTVDLDKYGVIIPRSLADELYGEGIPALGREMYWYDGLNYISEKIICVYEDFPKYMNIKNDVYLSLKDDIVDNVDYNFFCIYFNLEENLHIKIEGINHIDRPLTDFEEHNMRSETIQQILDEKFNEWRKNKMDTLLYTGVDDPYRYVTWRDSFQYDAYTKDMKVFVPSLQRPFDYTLTRLCEAPIIRDNAKWSEFSNSVKYLLLAISVLIIALICIVNISLTSAPLEMKNINIRMVLGTSIRRIWSELIFRYILMALVAFVLTVFYIIWIDVNKTYDSLMITSISLNDNWVVVFLTLLVGLALGLIGGIGTARFVTSLPMDRVLKAKVGMDRRSRRWRDIMLWIQLFLTAIPVILAQTTNSYIYTCDYKLYLFFAISSIFILFVTLFCMIMQQERYMFRSMAIRKVLGTTNMQLLLMNVWHYTKMVLQVVIVYYTIAILLVSIPLRISLMVYNFEYIFYAFIGINISFIIFFLKMEIIVLLPVIINTIISENYDLSNALKSE